jgi:hypothetical protein
VSLGSQTSNLNYLSLNLVLSLIYLGP